VRQQPLNLVSGVAHAFCRSSYDARHDADARAREDHRLAKVSPHRCLSPLPMNGSCMQHRVIWGSGQVHTCF
jgi:hypothetical protein